MERIMQDFVETNIITRRDVLDARLTTRGLVLTRTTQVTGGGARVSGLFNGSGALVGSTTRDTSASRVSIPSVTIGSLMAGSAVATYFLSPYIWVAAGLMAGAIYFLAFREKDTIDF